MDDLTETHQLHFECSCGFKATLYRGLYQSETGELCVLWRCIKCRASCLAVIAGMKPVLPFFNAEDIKILKGMNVGA